MFPIRLIDESPLMSAQELADLLCDQMKQPKTVLEPKTEATSTKGVVSRRSGWKDITP